MNIKEAINSKITRLTEGKEIIENKIALLQEILEDGDEEPDEMPGQEPNKDEKEPKKKKKKRIVRARKKKRDPEETVAAVPEEDDDEEEDEEDDQAFRKVEKADKIQKEMDQVKGELHGLTEDQSKILVAVLRENTTPKDISQETGITPSTVTQVVPVLKKIGLLESAGYGEYKITAKGRAKVKEV